MGTVGAEVARRQQRPIDVGERDVAHRRVVRLAHDECRATVRNCHLAAAHEDVVRARGNGDRVV
ncbi:MAG: hypothetical protein QOF83_2964 [Solirubrobacteraceae bacterium]|nr:hypothetical protein [Solirubrobacteraceae bacterium]